MLRGAGAGEEGAVRAADQAEAVAGGVLGLDREPGGNSRGMLSWSLDLDKL